MVIRRTAQSNTDCERRPLVEVGQEQARQLDGGPGRAPGAGSRAENHPHEPKATPHVRVDTPSDDTRVPRGPLPVTFKKASPQGSKPSRLRSTMRRTRRQPRQIACVCKTRLAC